MTTTPKMADWKRLSEPTHFTTRKRVSARHYKCHTVPHSCLSIAGESVRLSERPQRTLRSNSCILRLPSHVNRSTVTGLDNVTGSSLCSRREGTCSACSLQEADENMRQPNCMRSSPLLRTNASLPGGNTVETSHHTGTSAKHYVSNGHNHLQSLSLSELESQQLQLDKYKLLLLRCKQELATIERPKPKWYEMKTPEFHLEAHRQNSVLHNAAKWQRVLEGSDKLLFNEV